ncbi:hypothetical protein BGAL_0101g00280 [Botrytis galanthina]|uniref:Uncharacterized protein n=1 Tax=Botrytis galanthina TaxID=278940 RepID=A0A4V4HV33_9HELO|nr:hypothetical protein BGAL_0101g00280 [Botrytis galanthina]
MIPNQRKIFEESVSLWGKEKKGSKKRSRFLGLNFLGGRGEEREGRGGERKRQGNKKTRETRRGNRFNKRTVQLLD